MNDGPKIFRVVHVEPVRDLMGHKVVHYRFGGHNHPPGISNHTVPGAAPPASFAVLQTYPLNADSDDTGHVKGPGFEFNEGAFSKVGF